MNWETQYILNMSFPNLPINPQQIQLQPLTIFMKLSHHLYNLYRNVIDIAETTFNEMNKAVENILDNY